MGWQFIRIVGVSACVIFTLHQNNQKMAKCTFWYQLTLVVPGKVQRAPKWFCVYVYVYVYVMFFNDHLIIYSIMLAFFQNISLFGFQR